MKNILITGAAGFVGSNLALILKKNSPDWKIYALDNLYRAGSELNVPRLVREGVTFIRGDVRRYQDLESVGQIDFLIECSAEPSVLAGKDGNTDYLIHTNLNGALNCAEFCRKNNAGIIFLSTSRVYPYKLLAGVKINETSSRFEISSRQQLPGISPEGIAENFPMQGVRSLYGATKYAAEIMLDEFRDSFGIPVIINRCGVISGPWQFGKADQGIAAFWLAAHLFGRKLKYIGFGGSGKQVRDFLHIDDLANLIMLQLEKPEAFSNAGVFNAGGGLAISASLLELTDICQDISGRKIEINPDPELRYADIPVYLSDCAAIKKFCGWQPEKTVHDIIKDIFIWINSSEKIKALFC